MSSRFFSFIMLMLSFFLPESYKEFFLLCIKFNVPKAAFDGVQIPSSDKIYRSIFKRQCSEEEKEDFVKYFYSRGVKPSHRDTAKAAFHCSSRMLEKLLVEYNFPQWEEIYPALIERGCSVKEIKKFMDLGIPFNSNAMAEATDKNNFSMLKFLFANSFTYDSRVCSYATENGNEEILTWALRNKMPINDDAIHYAQKEGRIKLLSLIRNASHKVTAEELNQHRVPFEE